MTTPKVKRVDQAERALKRVDHTSRSPWTISAGVCFAAIAVCGFALASEPAAKIAWLNFGVILLLFACAIRSGRGFDKTHPLTWLATGLLVMYVLHPLAYIADGGFHAFYHDKLLTEPGYVQAMTLALLASVAVLIGWVSSALLWPEPAAQQKPAPAATSARERDSALARIAVVLSWALIAFAFIAFAAFAVSTGQNPISAVLGGAQRGSDTSSSAYLYLAPQAIGPATLLRCYANDRLGRSQWSVALLTAVQAVLYIPTGQRLVLILTLVPTFLFLAYTRKFRIGAIGTLLLLVGLLASVVVLRDAGSAEGTTLAESARNSLSHPERALIEFATGADTEMIDGLSIEVQRVPDVIAHQPGIILKSTLAAPIPSVIWHGKAVTADSVLNSEILGTKKNFASVAYGFVGELYFDSGPLGVFFGFVLFSAFAAWMWRYRLRHVADPRHMMLFYTLLPFLVIHLRGSLALTLGRALFIVGPVLLMLYLSRRVADYQPSANGGVSYSRRPGVEI